VERAHSVYAGDLREDVGAPRLRTARLCSNKRMQPGGANVHSHFPFARRWLREVFKARRLPQRMDDSSFHKEILSSLFRCDAMGAQAWSSSAAAMRSGCWPASAWRLRVRRNL